MAHDCTAIRDDLVAFLDAALDATRARDVEAHLATCAACEAERRALAAAWSSLDLLPGAEIRPGFLAELEARILRSEPRVEQPVALRALEGGRRANRGVHRWLAAAAAALIAAGAGLFVLTRSPPRGDVAIQPDRPAPDRPTPAPPQDVPPDVATDRRPPDPGPATPSGPDPLQTLPAEERELVQNLDLLRDLQELDDLGLLDAVELFDDMDAEEFDEG